MLCTHSVVAGVGRCWTVRGLWSMHACIVETSYTRFTECYLSRSICSTGAYSSYHLMCTDTPQEEPLFLQTAATILVNWRTVDTVFSDCASADQASTVCVGRGIQSLTNKSYGTCCISHAIGTAHDHWSTRTNFLIASSVLRVGKNSGSHTRPSRWR